jgi:hypothetical protein
MITTKDLTDPIGKRFQWTPDRVGGVIGYRWKDWSSWFDVECTNTRVAGWFRKRLECEVKPSTGPGFWVKRDSLREKPQSPLDFAEALTKYWAPSPTATKKKGKKK